MTVIFLKRKELHPYLALIFVLFQTLRLYGNHFSFSIFSQLVSILMALVGIIWLFQIFIWKKFLSASPSFSILFSFCLLWFLLWEPAVNTLRILFGFVRERYLFILYVLVVLSLAFLSNRNRKWKLTVATTYMNVLLLVLSLFEGYQFFIASRNFSIVNNKFKPTDKLDINNRPDIYLILLDGYTNPESTPRYFGFENRGLVDSLSDKGFYVIKDSKSNYKFTYQSVGSALNMAYLSDPFPESFITFKSINDNFFVKSAKVLGYQICNLSIFNINDQSSPFRLRDFAPESFEYSDFLFSRTVVASFLRKNLHIPLNDRSSHENSIEGFRSLDRIASDTSSSPRFVYLHSLICHGPFWMDSSGEYSDSVVKRNMAFASKDLASWLNGKFENTNLGDVQVEQSIVKDYQRHLGISNKLTLKSVENILKSKPNSVIIVMSDHGFRYLMRHSVEDTKAEQYANFCAVYFPDRRYGELSMSMTPINVFRAVSNEVFGTSLNFLQDTSGL